MFVSRAKTAEPIEVRFIELIHVGPRNHVLHEGPDYSSGWGNFGRLSSLLKNIGNLCCVNVDLYSASS